jgi:hypothetical protein
MALNLANVQTSDTFQTWFTRTNQIISSAFPTTGGTITGSLTVDGDALFSGNTTIVNKTTISTTDALIQLASNNEITDILDIGFFAHYNSGSGNNHTGLIRDSGTKEYYLFGQYQPGAEPVSDININHASFGLANVHVYKVTSNNIVTHNIASTGNIVSDRNITAAAFIGDGSGLSDVGITTATDGANDRALRIPFTGITSGQLTSANTHSALLYNPSIGTLFATDFDSTSDERLKKNIKPIEGALDKVTKLVGVEFDWINTDKKSIGVIAQQVEEVVPELVHTNSKGYKSVSYGNLVALLIEAIKELSENSKTGNDQ